MIMNYEHKICYNVYERSSISASGDVLCDYLSSYQNSTILKSSDDVKIDLPGFGTPSPETHNTRCINPDFELI